MAGRVMVGVMGGLESRVGRFLGIDLGVMINPFQIGTDWQLEEIEGNEPQFE